MKRFYLVALGTAALAMTFACTKNEDGKEPGGGDPVQLAKPVLKSTTTATSFTITWDAVENAGGYMVKYNDTETPVTECTFTQDVEPGSYVVAVKATTADPEKYTDSEYAEITVTVENGGSDSWIDGDGTWYGMWKVSSTKTISFEQQATNVLDEPVTKEVEITEGEDGTYYILGWSDMTYTDESYIPGVLMSLEGSEMATDNPEDLGFINGVQVAAAGSAGEIPTWVAFCDVAGEYTFVTGSYPAFTFDINDEFNYAELIAYEGELSNGGTFKVFGMDIFGLTETNVYLYGEFPINFPAGDFTIGKTANASSASRANVNFSNTIEASAVMSSASVASAR